MKNGEICIIRYDVTVVMPAYNAEDFIELAIASIKNQTYPVKEIIVIDDGSTDSTYEIVKELMKDHKALKIIKQDNKGASAARNIGISKSNSEWLLFMDADDECSSKLIEIYIKEIRKSGKHNEISAVYSAYQQIDEQSTIISTVLRGEKFTGNEGFCNIIKRNTIISPSGVLVKKSAIIEMNGFNTSIKYVEDVDLWTRLLGNNHIIEYIDEPLSFIRRHNSNTTSSMGTSHEAEKAILNQYGLEIIKEKLFSRDYSPLENALDYADFLLRYKEWGECLELLNELVVEKTSTYYVMYIFLRSICHIEHKEYDKALELYEDILTINPEHGSSLNNAGVLYSTNGLHEKAKEILLRALQLYPNYLDAQYNLQCLENEESELSHYRFTMRELRPVLLSYSTD